MSFDFCCSTVLLPNTDHDWKVTLWLYLGILQDIFYTSELYFLSQWFYFSQNWLSDALSVVYSLQIITVSMFAVRIKRQPTEHLPQLSLWREILFFRCSHNLIKFFIVFSKFNLSSPNHLEEVQSTLPSSSLQLTWTASCPLILPRTKEMNHDSNSFKVLAMCLSN